MRATPEGLNMPALKLPQRCRGCSRQAAVFRLPVCATPLARPVPQTPQKKCGVTAALLGRDQLVPPRERAPQRYVRGRDVQVLLIYEPRCDPLGIPPRGRAAAPPLHPRVEQRTTAILLGIAKTRGPPC